MTDLVPSFADGYEIEPTPLRGASKRSDWLVRTEPGSDAGTLDRPSTTTVLRQLFADLYDEADRRKGDPIATGRALLNVETLLRDLRSLAAKLKKDTGTTMEALGIRRITLEEAGVWEATSSLTRSDWNTERVVRDYLQSCGVVDAVDRDGEFCGVEHVARLVADLYGPSNGPRMTPLKDAGLKPDDYCTVAVDEEGKYVRDVSVRVHDNRTGDQR